MKLKITVLAVLVSFAAIGENSDNVHPSIFAAETTKVPGHDDGVPVADKYQCYREPVMVKTKSGRLVVGVHAGNRLSWPERSGQDLVVSYSDDNGKTWNTPIVAAEHKNFSCQSHGMVYDAVKNRINFLYVTYNWDYTLAGKGRGAKVTAPIYQKMHKEGKPFLNAYMVYSDDEGQTWSKPRDISKMVTGFSHFGASEGRQLTVGKYAGRLIIAGGAERNMNPSGKVINKTIGTWISDDHGKNWRFSQIKANFSLSCEARITELPDGSLLYVGRPANGKGRVISFSKDGGDSWSDAIINDEIVAARSNSSLLTIRNKEGKLTQTVLCSVPRGRTRHGSIYVSKDGGKTWPIHNLIVPKGYFKYSAIVQIDVNTIAFIYETNHYKDINFVSLSIADILQGDK